VGVEVLGADTSVGVGVRVGAVVSVGVGVKVGAVVSVGVEVNGGTEVSVGSRVEVKVVVGRKPDASGDNCCRVGGEVTVKAAGTVRVGLFTAVGGSVRGSGVAVASITAAAAGVARAGSLPLLNTTKPIRAAKSRAMPLPTRVITLHSGC
jgi:hypothetical protein